MIQNPVLAEIHLDYWREALSGNHLQRYLMPL